MEEDFDLTQTVTVWSDEEDQDTDTDQVALLKVFKQTGVPSELEFTLFKGVNKIGRSDSCEVCIKNKVLSKEHAAIEVGSDWFLICDLGSANKTWRCKKHLKPNVKYKLEPNEELIFGNIRTQFVLLSESKEHEETDSETGSESMLLTKEATQTFPLAAMEKDIDEEKHLQKDITSSQNNLATYSERISLKSNEGNKDSILAKPDRDSSIKASDDETDCESSEDYEKIEKQGTNFSPTLIDNLEIDAIVNMKCKVSNSSHLTEESSIPVRRIVENVDNPIVIAEERECINTALNSSGNLPETFPESLPGTSKFINVCHLKNYHQADQSIKISTPDFSPAETFENLPVTQVNMDLAQYVERSNICDDSNNSCPSEVGQVKKVTNSFNFCNEQNNNHCYEARIVDNKGMPPTQPKIAENQVGADVNKWNELNDDDDDDLPETQVCGAINKSSESDEYDDDLPETQVCSTVNSLKKSEDNNDLPITQICVNKSYELDNADKNLSNLSDSELPQTIPNFVALECNIKSCLPCSHKNDLSPVGSCTVTNPSNSISSFNSSKLGNAKMVSTNNDTNAFGESSMLNPYKKQIFSGINISIEEEDSLEKDISVLCPSTQRRSDSKECKVKNTDVYGSPNLKATEDEGKDSIAETPPHLLKECNTSSESSAKKGISCIKSLFKGLPDNAACFSQSQELNDFCSSNLKTKNELYFRSKANVTNKVKGHPSTGTSENSEVFVITGKVNYASNCSPKVYKKKLDVLSHDQISIKISPEKLKEINNNCGSVNIDPSCDSECSNRGKNCERISAFLPLEGSAKKVNTGVHEVFDNLNQVHNEIQDSFYRTYSRKKCANKSANSTTPINNKEQGANSDTEQKQAISKRKSKRLNSLDSKPVSCLPQKTEIVKTKLIDSSSKEDSHSKVNLREIFLRSTQNSTALASHHKAEKNDKVNDSKGTKLSRAKKRSSRVHRRLSKFDEIQNPVDLNENSNVTGNDHNSAINSLIAVEEIQGGEDYSDCPSPTKKRKKRQTNLKKNYTSISTPKSGVSTRGFCAFKSVEMDMPENKEFHKKLSSKQVCEMKSMGSDSILIKSENNFQDNGFSPFKKDGLSSISTNTENIYSSQPLSSRTRSCKSNNISVNKEIVIAFNESFPCMESKNKISVQSLIKNISPRLRRSQIKEENKPAVTVRKLPMSLELDSKPIRRTRNSMCSTETSKPEVLKSKNESNTLLLKIEKENISLNADSKSVSDNKKLKKGKSKGCKRKESSNETHRESVIEENESISCVHQENSAIITNLFCKPQELAKNVAKKRVDKTKLSDKSSIDLCKDLPKIINKRKSVEQEHTKSNLVKQEPEHFIDSNNVCKLSSENFNEKKCSDKSPRQLTKNSNISQKFVGHVEDNSTIKKRTIFQACCNGNKQIQEVTVKKNRNSDTSKNASDNISETFATPVKNRRGQKSNNRSKSKVQFISPVSKTFQSSDKPKVMFTMVEDEDPQKIVVHLGGKVTEDFNQCTQLVTDKLRRTVKALCCIAKGIPLVNTRWLQQCKKVNSFVDYTPFLIKDKTAERQHGFSLQTTLEKSRENHLLTAWSIHVTPKVQPPPEQMKDVIQCADGKYLPKMPNRLSARTVIISCASDLHLCSHAAKCGIPILSAEFLLTGLLRYEINIKSYELT